MTIGRKRLWAASTAASWMLRPGLAQLARHLDDQDRVLGRQRDQQHQPDLRVEVVGDRRAPAVHRRCPAARAARRRSPPPGSPSCRTGRRAPGTRAACARAKMRYAELPASFSWYDIAVHSLLRARRQRALVTSSSMVCSDCPELKPGGGQAVDGAGGVQVVEADERRPLGVVDVRQRADRHHRAAGAAHVVAAQVLGREAIVAVGLHEHREHAPELLVIWLV